jgi:hypothetical protein
VPGTLRHVLGQASLILVLAAAAPGDGCPRAVEAVVATLDPEAGWVGALLVDATGNGEPEVFIADTDRGGNAGEPWRVYRRTGRGEYAVLGSVFLHPLGFKADGPLLKTYSRRNATSGRFFTYRVSEDSIREISATGVLRAGDAEFEERWGEIAAWRESLRGGSFSASRRLDGASGARVICRPAGPH